MRDEEKSSEETKEEEPFFSEDVDDVDDFGDYDPEDFS